MNKNLYKIVVNYYSQSLTYYRHATSANHALKLICRALAKEANTNPSFVRNHLESGDHYLITKEVNNEETNKAIDNKGR